MKRTGWICSLTVLVLMAFTIPAAAQMIWHEPVSDKVEYMQKHGGRIHRQKLEVIPYVAARGVYESNIFLGNHLTEAARPEESDYMFRVDPGLLLTYDMGVRGYANAGYFGEWAFYDKRTDNNWDMQNGLVDVLYTAPGGLIAGVYDLYSNGNDPFGDATQYDLGVTRDRWRNNFRGKVGYEFASRWRAMGFVNQYKQDYKNDRDSTQDWTTTEVGAGAEMKVFPKTWAFVRYHYGKQDFDTHIGGVTSDNDSSNRRDRVNTGLAWDGGGKLSGEFNVGWAWLGYDNDFDTAGRPYDDANTWTARTYVTYQATPLTRLRLIVARDIRPTGSNTREYYEDTYAGLRVDQDLPYKLFGRARVIYDRNDFNTSRLDNNYRADVLVRYQVQPWLFAGAEYRYWKKDSNDPEYSFKDHQVIVSIGSTY